MIVRLNPDAAFREVAGEVFIVTADRAMHQFTTPTAVAIFRQLRSTPTTVDALATALTRQFAVSPAEAIGDVRRFVETLLEREIAVPLSANSQR